jgi:hypothetical protein
MRACRCLLVVSAFFLLLRAVPPGGAEVFVTKDGGIYTGDTVGQTTETILIRTAEGTVILKKADLVELPAAVLEARGIIHAAAGPAAAAAAALEADEPGQAIALWQAAISALSSIPAEAEEELARAKALAAELQGKLDAATTALHDKGLAAYKGQVFAEAVLAYHLDAGHILVGHHVWIEPSQICAACRGAGSVACTACSGTGGHMYDCPDCKAGHAVCPICNGTGEKVCPTCGGSRHVMTTCRDCRGTGRERCHDCHGTGRERIECPRCDGTGEIVRYRRWVVDEDGHRRLEIITRECPDCDGKGRIYVTCDTCGGSGTVACRTCNGGGKVAAACPTCKGRGAVYCPRWVLCKRCGGRGALVAICSACNGTGRTTCSACQGLGFHGDPQRDPPAAGNQPLISTE